VQNYFLSLVKINNHTVTISPPLCITKFNSQINISMAQTFGSDLRDGQISTVGIRKIFSHLFALLASSAPAAADAVGHKPGTVIVQLTGQIA